MFGDKFRDFCQFFHSLGSHAQARIYIQNAVQGMSLKRLPRDGAPKNKECSIEDDRTPIGHNDMGHWVCLCRDK